LLKLVIRVILEHKVQLDLKAHKARLDLKDLKELQE
jgi:hypothetical protein